MFQVNAEKLEEIHIPQMLFEAICSKKNKQTRNDKVRKANLTLNAQQPKTTSDVSKNGKITLLPT